MDANDGRSDRVITDHKFTGQKQDGSGLYYYNARYYDPQIGHFISPDTIVPDPLRVDAYNRYQYTLGNPVKYSDPSGNYPDDVLQTHFGCDDWGCVEAQFQDGGQHAGRWGWLKILMTAEDGDAITSSYVDSVGNRQTFSGHFATTDGRIVIQPSISVASSTNGINIIHHDPSADPVGAATGAVLGALGVTGGYHLNGANGTVGTTYEQQHLDCRHTDCTQRALNAGATGSATVAAVCAASFVGNAGCSQTALALSAALSGAGMLRTGYKTFSGDGAALDVAIAFGLLKAGTTSNPYVAAGVNATQWAWDEFVSPHLPQAW